MDNETKIVVMDVDGLKNLMRQIVSDEFEKFDQKLRERKLAEKPYGDKLRKKEVAELIGCSLKTVTTYYQKGILPAPTIGINGKPYWTKEEVLSAIRANDLAWKYNL